MNEERYEKAIALLRETQMFHTDRIKILKELNKKKLSGYEAVMARIYKFLREEDGHELGVS